MYRNWTNLRILFDADGVPSGTPAADPDAAFQRLLDRNNSDGIQLARQLFSENYDYRKEVRDLKAQLDGLSGKVPGEGALVLSAEDAEAWKAYKELGDVADVKQGLEQRTQLQEQLDEAQRTETLRTVATAAGYKPNVLGQLERMARASGKDLTFEVREQTVDGQTVQIPIVKDGETEQPLSEYAAAQWADFMPSLAVGDTNGTQGASQGGIIETPTNSVPAGLRFPPQHPGGGPAKPTSLVDRFVQEQNEQAKAAKNPLLKS